MVGIRTLSIAATLAVVAKQAVASLGKGNYLNHDTSVNFLDQKSGINSNGPRPEPTKIAKISEKYIIAVDDGVDFSDDKGKVNRNFLIELIKNLYQNNGQKAISLIRFSGEAPKTQTKLPTKDGYYSSIGEEVKTQIKTEPAVDGTGIGVALRQIMRLYPKQNEFLIRDVDTELEYSKALGKDTVVVIFTNGHVVGPQLAYNEAFDARRNGVRLFVVNRGGKSENFWTQLLGCHYSTCPNYISARTINPIVYLDLLVSRIVSKSARDAVCLEKWTEYVPNQVPSDVKIMTSTLESFKTLVKESIDERNNRGRTCDEQLRNVQSRQIMCYKEGCNPTVYSRTTFPELLSKKSDAQSGTSDNVREATGAEEDRNERRESLPADSEQAEKYLRDLEAKLDVVSEGVTEAGEKVLKEEADEPMYEQLEYYDKQGVLISDLFSTTHDQQTQLLKHGDHNPAAGNHNTPHRREARRSGRKGTILIGCVCFIIVCSVVAGTYVSLSQQDSFQLDAEDGDFLDGSSGGKDEEPESQQIIDANNQVWA